MLGRPPAPAPRGRRAATALLRTLWLLLAAASCFGEVSSAPSGCREARCTRRAVSGTGSAMPASSSGLLTTAKLAVGAPSISKPATRPPAGPTAGNRTGPARASAREAPRKGPPSSASPPRLWQRAMPLGQPAQCRAALHEGGGPRQPARPVGREGPWRCSIRPLCGSARPAQDRQQRISLGQCPAQAAGGPCQGR